MLAADLWCVSSAVFSDGVAGGTWLFLEMVVDGSLIVFFFFAQRGGLIVVGGDGWLANCSKLYCILGLGFLWHLAHFGELGFLCFIV